MDDGSRLQNWARRARDLLRRMATAVRSYMCFDLNSAVEAVSRIVPYLVSPFMCARNPMPAYRRGNLHQGTRVAYVIADESMEDDEEIIFSRAFDVSVLRRHGDPDVVEPRTLKTIIVGASKKMGDWV